MELWNRIQYSGKSFEIDSSKILVDRLEKDHLKVVNDGTLTVALDSEITDELRREGFVRDLIRGIQNMRKERGFEVTDRITLSVSGSAELKESFESFIDFIAGETLAAKSLWLDTPDKAAAAQIEAGEEIWYVSIEKA